MFECHNYVDLEADARFHYLDMIRYDDVVAIKSQY